MAQNLTGRIIDTYGNLIGQHIGDAPDGVRWWLDFAFNAERVKVNALPELNVMPYQRQAAAIALDSVTDALNDFQHAVVTSIFLPNEVFLAMGLKPVTAEAMSGFTTAAHAESGFVTAAEEAGVPETYCSFHKVLIGLAKSGVLEAPPMLASCSVACDANNLTFKVLGSHWHIPHVYVDVPYETDDESIHYVADQLRQMAEVAQQTYGVRLDPELLRQHVANSLQTQECIRRSTHLRRGRFMRSDMGNEMQIALATHLAMGTDATLRMAQQMEKDLAHAKPFDGVSLVWAHVPPFFLKPIADLVSQSKDVQIVASDMLYDQVHPTPQRYDETQPFESMAERLVPNSYNGPSTRRAQTLLRMARQTDAQGAIVFCHWGCKETAGAAQLMRHTLEDAGYPTLVLDGDACDRGNCMEGQMSTRFSAFVEMLQAQREEVADGVA
ncbi:MAG: 2-hydroxyacyl-CoA dehydratase subunit D [Atopobiaceae bacterium]